MIKVNPVHFLNVERGHFYIPNPQYLSTVSAGHTTTLLKSRVGCLLVAVHLKMNQIPNHSILTFKCVREHHKARFCAGISPLKLSKDMFSHRQLTTAGNLLLEVYNERCHACGEQKRECWREFTGHFICGGCVARDRGKAPYVYGRTENKCCVDNQCGRGVGLYSESGHSLFSKAVAIYERYNHHDV